MTDIFVFGSNTAGRHGKGAAKAALRNHGAIYGQGEGLQGKSYAIPTKGERWPGGPLHTLQLPMIGGAVYRFLTFASEHPELRFHVTPIGCGLAGYKPEDIAHFFIRASDDVSLPEEFREALDRA